MPYLSLAFEGIPQFTKDGAVIATFDIMILNVKKKNYLTAVVKAPYK